MRRLTAIVAALAISAAAAQAEELKSGLQPGEKIGAFNVVKSAGAAEDGVPEGEELCYRCMLGNRPVVAVFARSANKPLIKLIQQLDKVVAENKDQKMGSFVNLLGEDAKKLDKAAKRLIKRSEAENVAVVVPVENENGPEALQIHEDADLTVLIYREGVIKVNHAFAKGKLNKKAIAKVIKDTGAILQ